MRQVIGNNKQSKWTVDKNGVDLTKLIIQPLVEKVIEILKKFIKDCHENIQKIEKLNDDVECDTKETLKNMENANSVIMTIKLKKNNTEILKYIAPHFNLKIDQNNENVDSENE